MSTIIGTLLTGNSAAMVADAVTSVLPFIDKLLLIDTGITDDTREIVRSLAGEKYSETSWQWQNNFAAARNFALDEAAHAGAAWSLTIDTDERLQWPGVDSLETLRTTLTSRPEVLAWFVPYESGFYAKERLIRVPSILRWGGRVHECLLGANRNQRATLAGVSFSELQKSPESMQGKLQRDLKILLEETERLPEEMRWWYYLGQTYQSLKEWDAAIAAYRRAWECEGWDEQAAWGMYQAASCANAVKHYQEAIEYCSLGLARLPSFPELAWLAGFSAYKLQRYEAAIHWCQMAIAIGHFEGSRSGEQRVSFRHLPGWYEGPYDVLRHVYRKLKQPALAKNSQAKYTEAMAIRTQKHS